MAGGAGGPSVRGDGRTLAEPDFPDDDGTADPRIRAALVDVGRTDHVAVARALRSARLLACVLAVADEVDGSGADTGTHMALVSMVNERGEKGLLAFTGVDSLAAWDPRARPVPALGREVARSAIDDGSVAVVLDVSGPQRLALVGVALAALADRIDMAGLTTLVVSALAPLTADGWADAHVEDVRDVPLPVDVLVRISAQGSVHPDGRGLEQLVQQAAAVLASRLDIQRLVPGGLGVMPASGP